MDHASDDPLRERAASIEPGSTRPKPFDDTDASARKRQRRGSRSISVDTALPDTPDPTTLHEVDTNIEADSASVPHTPTRPSTMPPSQLNNSSKVTINLRTDRPLEAITSSPPSPTPPSQAVLQDAEIVSNSLQDTARKSVESESDALSTVPAIETPTSTSSEGSPEIELVAIDDVDSDFGMDESPAVAIVNDDADYEGETDPMTTFPYRSQGELSAGPVKKLASHFRYELIEDDSWFRNIAEWLDSFCLFTANRSDRLLEALQTYWDFWEAFPQLIWALQYRNRYFGHSGFSRERVPHQGRGLTDFLVQFARLSARLAVWDSRNLYKLLKRDVTEEVELASGKFLLAYTALIFKGDASLLGANLQNHYKWNWEEEVATLQLAFRNEGASFHVLCRLVEGQLAMIQHNSKFVDSLSAPCQLVESLLFDAAIMYKNPEGYTDEQIKMAQQHLLKGHDFFKTTSAGLMSIIEKQVTTLSPEPAKLLITSLTSILRYIVVIDHEATRTMFEHLQQHEHRPHARFYPRVISLEWKLSILKKLIMSTQMQLRVFGVTTMCSDLLGVYNENRSLAPLDDNPVLHYIANFIISNKIIPYLVGTGSHPEIINDSFNIVGFLIATKTYSDELADTIWQSVTNSQDPRVVEAVLKVYKNTLNLYDYESLLKLCRKVNTLPIDSFTSGMRELCEKLFNEMQGKTYEVNVGPRNDSAPADLCVRLIRESSNFPPETPLIYHDTQKFAVDHLRTLISVLDDSNRRRIYRECTHDISSRSLTAPGSILVIHSLLGRYKTELHELASDQGLTSLLIQELESAIAEDPDSSSLYNRRGLPYMALRELLFKIMVQVPETISHDLGGKLWNSLVGPGSKKEDRDASWALLMNAKRTSPLDNQFFSTCYQDHLPTLPPECFTAGALDFVKDAVQMALKRVPQTPAEEDFNCPLLEQVWRMILTAPHATIDAAAITTLVDSYINSKFVHALPQLKARAIHSTVVNRCLEQLAGAAAKLKSFNQDGGTIGDDDGMVIVISNSEFQEQEMTFARSLAVLREFLQAYQVKKQYAIPTPKLRSPVAIISSAVTVEGEPRTVKYQAFDGDTQTDIKEMVIGTKNSAASLFAGLQMNTNFEHYRVYWGGHYHVPDIELEICKSFDDLKLNGLVLIQRRKDSDSPVDSIEMEIMKHIDELWGYLGMQEAVAKEIYFFLVKFPLYHRVIEDIRTATVSYTEIFPQGKPYKSLYAIHTLREFIFSESQKGAVNEAALTRATSLIVSAMPELCESRDVSRETRSLLAYTMIDCFANLLTENKIPPSAIVGWNDILLHCLLQLLQEAKADGVQVESSRLVCRAFDAILEAASQSPDFWALVKVHVSTSEFLRDLLLVEPRQPIRRSIMKTINTKSVYHASHAQVKSPEILETFWSPIVEVVSDVSQYLEHTEEVFQLAENLLKRLAETDNNSINLDGLLESWMSQLIYYAPHDKLERLNRVDPIARGLASLCYCAASLAEASQKPLSCRSLGVELLQKHLFPDTSAPADEETLVISQLPLVDSHTRHKISETIFILVKDDAEEYKRILQSLDQLTPYDAKLDHPYLYDFTNNFERSKAIRSSTGYVGLRNLSNTCYLNSLFTQLFMNIPFREFMLKARVADGGASQKLLRETQLLFGYMQNSLERFVDPSNLAGSIRTFDNTNIDVTVQMDVDEFYNLIFDRWESQIIGPADKRKFRSFYGGQLVQQVKSRECPHISERLEPFLAIQCDIKGKSNLQESLQAYVDGEIMDGDNKYKCSTCDRHVDAVKRACLKDVPDNLIFHLKRFDFNLKTLMRGKVNDWFSFPRRIDMRPYKVEHLMNEPGTYEDIFELVGVLVHAGTAESGHYYSYIRERPTTSDKEPWVEFNDDLVTPWDTNQLENHCFGGPEYNDVGSIPFEKNYSAYMLLYQRSSTLSAQTEAVERSVMSCPIRVPLPPGMSNHIVQNNELLMRKYCLYDPSHAAFVLKLLSNMKQINKGECSPTHDLERLAINSSMNFLDQVVVRNKEVPDFTNFVGAMRRICQSCADCSCDFLEWFYERPQVIRQLIQRSPEGLVRTEIATSILHALAKVKTDRPDLYADEDGPEILQKTIQTVDRLWETFQSSTRSWPEYFGLLLGISKMGEIESAVLLDHQYLQRCMEIVTADTVLPLSPQYQRMLINVNKRSTTRPVSFDPIIGLLDQLLQTCDLTLEAAGDREQRLEVAMNGSPIPINDAERELMVQQWTRNGANILTQKLIMVHHNFDVVRNIIAMLLNSPDNLDTTIFNAIISGIREAQHCKAYLQAALVYCEHTDNVANIKRMVFQASQAIESDSSDGSVFLNFLMTLPQSNANRNDIPNERCRQIILETCNVWGPKLLNSYIPNVRNDTETYLTNLLLRFAADLDNSSLEDQSPQDLMFMRKTGQKLGFGCLNHLTDTYLSESGRQALRPHLDCIIRVIQKCKPFFDSGSKDQSDFLLREQNIVPDVKAVTVDEVPDDSEWDGSEDGYGSSEPMDSIAELVRPSNEAMDVETQL